MSRRELALTDRLAALTTEIGRLGGDARELADGLEVHPVPLHGAELRTYHDHRMATFAAVVGLRVPGTGIVDVATTAKTMPDFPALWTALVAPGDAAEEAGEQRLVDGVGVDGRGEGARCVVD